MNRAEIVAGFSPRYGRWAESNTDRAASIAADPPVITPEYLETRFAGMGGGPSNSRDDFCRHLRTLKYEAMYSICVQDFCGLVPLGDYSRILAQITATGEFAVDAATRWALAEAERQWGPPVYPGFDGKSATAQFAVLGLGKLGAGELNFSSDVDLIFLHSTVTGEPEKGATALPPADYFSRVGQMLSRALSDRTGDGFVFRVDLNLRPEGKAGPLVLPLEAMANYYEMFAAAWEKSALAKARPVGGSRALGGLFLKQMEPVIYRRYLDFAAVSSIRSMKGLIEDRENQKKQETISVKLGEGGIRDLEFFVQALCLLYGGKIPDLRTRSAIEGLRQLRLNRLLSQVEHDRLLEAYLFLRRTENHIQMAEEEQAYDLPAHPEALEGLARSMGFAGGATAATEPFLEELAAHMKTVRQSFDAFFSESRDSRIGQRLRSQFNLAALSRDIEEQLDAIARRLEGEISRTADAEMAHTNLELLMDTIGRRMSFWGTLLDNPALCERLVSVLGSSDFLSKILVRNWRMLDRILSADSADASASIGTLRESFAGIRARCAPDAGATEVAEEEINCLRTFRNLHTLEVGLLDLAGDIDTPEASRRLTWIARVCLEEALKLALKDSLHRHGEPVDEETGKPARFAIIGMGKLGAGEMSYGSDLDVIFLFSGAGETRTTREGQKQLANIEFFIRVAQRLISYLTVKTAEGSCYEVDARLRPSGNAGLLVTSFRQFCTYHEKSAQTWEKQALLKGRFAAGDEPFGSEIEKAIRHILIEAPTGSIASEIAHLRSRMEKELAKEDIRHKNPKTGRGGIVDIEYTVQYLQLRHFRQHPDRLWQASTLDAIRELNGLKLLPDEDAQVLLDGYTFIQRLSSRMRIVQDRPMKDIDLEPTELDALAYRMGYSGGGRTEARRRLMDDYRRHTEAVRDVYLRTLGIGE